MKRSPLWTKVATIAGRSSSTHNTQAWRIRVESDLEATLWARRQPSGRHAEREGAMLTNIKLRMIGLALIPFDLMLKFFGPRYTLFYWFFKITPPPMVAWVSGLRAVRASAHAARKVPAYREFLKSNGASPANAARLDLPLTDKENYIRPYPPEQRCLNGKLPLAGTAIDESSGSTGTPYNWIRSLEERRVSHTFISHFAKYCYWNMGWITINAFSMGAWTTGVNMGIALQHNSIVKNTGPDMDKIFDTLEYFGSSYRYLICGYPPFLKHMIDAAEERGFSLGEYRLMVLLGGEGNSEGLQDYLLTHFRRCTPAMALRTSRSGSPVRCPRASPFDARPDTSNVSGKPSSETTPSCR